MTLSEIGKPLLKCCAVLRKEKNELISQLKSHIDVLVKHAHGGSGTVKRVCFAGDLDQWGEDTFGDDGAYVLIDYNDACHCHSDYQVSSHLISWDDMDLTPETYDAELFRREETKKRIKAEKEEEEEKERIEKILAAEKDIYNRLKAKFG